MSAVKSAEAMVDAVQDSIVALEGVKDRVDRLEKMIGGRTMSDIPIPPEVVEAAARASYDDWRTGGREQAPTFDRLHPLAQDEERQHARASIAAALAAWPGMSVAPIPRFRPFKEAETLPHIILPLPSQKDSEI